MREDRTLDALTALRRRACELIVAWLPLAQPDLTVGPVLTREERVLLVGVGHPLLEKGYATVEDLGDYAVVDLEGMLPPETCEVFCPRLTPSGRPIKRIHRARGAADVLAAVAAGATVHPTVAALPEHYRHPGVIGLPVHGLPPVAAALSWLTDRETAAIRALAQVASDIHAGTHIE